LEGASRLGTHRVARPRSGIIRLIGRPVPQAAVREQKGDEIRRYRTIADGSDGLRKS
jgi:hypothetical protein